jgi:hypothetical protein
MNWVIILIEYGNGNRIPNSITVVDDPVRIVAQRQRFEKKLNLSSSSSQEKEDDKKSEKSVYDTTEELEEEQEKETGEITTEQTREIMITI